MVSSKFAYIEADNSGLIPAPFGFSVLKCEELPWGSRAMGFDLANVAEILENSSLMSRDRPSTSDCGDADCVSGLSLRRV